MHFDLIWKQTEPMFSWFCQLLLVHLVRAAVHTIHRSPADDNQELYVYSSYVYYARQQCIRTDDSEEGAAMCVSVASVLKQSGSPPQNDSFT